MAISGHHSKASLRNYIGRPSSEKIRACSDILSDALSGRPHQSLQPSVTALSPRAIFTFRWIRLSLIHKHSLWTVCWPLGAYFLPPVRKGAWKVLFFYKSTRPGETRRKLGQDISFWNLSISFSMSPLNRAFGSGDLIQTFEYGFERDFEVEVRLKFQLSPYSEGLL